MNNVRDFGAAGDGKTKNVSKNLWMLLFLLIPALHLSNNKNEMRVK